MAGSFINKKEIRLTKIVCFLLVRFLIGFDASYAQGVNVKGLYVDGFNDILGNSVKEDSLLNFAQLLGINYFTLYELHIIHNNMNITNPTSAAPLAKFIRKAKTQYNIRIGGCGENFNFFKNVLDVYNQQHSDTLEKFDVYNLEFEFWNSVPNGYLCTTYLIPNSYSCDTAGAFAFYVKQLRSIDSLANLHGVKSETYVGWFNAGQASQMSKVCDRILLHAYVKTDATVYSYSEPRLIHFGNGPRKVTLLPIFCADGGSCIMPGSDEFMGAWLASNPEQKAFNTYLNKFNSAVGSWKNNIILEGYQWFSYKCLRQNYKSLPTDINESEKDFSIKAINTENELIYLFVNSPAEYNGNITLTNILGKTMLSQPVVIGQGSQQIILASAGLGTGVYILQFTAAGRDPFVTTITK